ncbi:MAG: hypothetical protein QOD04_4016 [Pseudonocardiales bacterium]|nr:hypothetical protein [Pseudonocardiales bacterium]
MPGSARLKAECEFRSRVVLLEFPSYDEALTCYRSDAYQAARDIRLRCADSAILAMEGRDELVRNEHIR